jgi:FAD/FMN-containing dehydrogenase
MAQNAKLRPPDPQLLRALKAAAGPRGIVEEEHELAPFTTDWRELYRGRTPLVVRPADTRQVAEILRLCSQAQVAVVPQGGNTGLVGGSVPDASGTQILLSLSRLNRIRAIDPEDFTITVEAGCVLQSVQEAAAQAERLFPLSLGAEGRCQIGGVISTNAGGTAVLRYGNMRDLVLGIEAVLPDGRIWNGLKRLRKDNTGYDLKQLFIGAEGTLGVVTAAVLKLFPRPRETVTGLAAVPNAQAAVALLAGLRAGSGDAVTSFELMARNAVALANSALPGTADPFPDAPWCVLIELASSSETLHLRAAAEKALADAMEAGLLLDATLAESEAQALAFARGDRGGAARLRPLDQARCVGGRLGGAGDARQDRCGGGDGVSRRAADALRPCRRREHPLQPAAAHRARGGSLPRQGGRADAGRA